MDNFFCIILEPGRNVIKLFTAVIYECLQKARVFSLADLSSLV
jgi:hypothetical protein